ncbi:hypothetical protein CPHO_08185 [Corynebacterium phocae]|uniref:Secreted protein n=1 Tax=Corynebacterium phocae TaxID=161895 RepID=A0A1L7D486_9CORY|nr:hypothetical protein [Corynebacterium phocae]APT92867.1 hypothetical protein CPHO_08185 [Corynebacterium phocae]KAA8723186.1 hypothetical protein F4V58_07690 [Corynebacterium phocae]
MKKLATIACTAALGFSATLSAPAAGAQTLEVLGALDKVVSQTIESSSCDTVKTVLTSIDASTPGVLMDANTTRSQLANNLRALGNSNVSAAGALALPAIRYSNKTADKAVACGLVKPDPASNDPFGLSSKFNDYAPFLQMLSSQALNAK